MAVGTVKVSKQLLEIMLFGALEAEIVAIQLVDDSAPALILTVMGPDVPVNDGLLTVRTVKSVDTYFEPTTR